MKYYIIPIGRQIANLNSINACSAKGSITQCQDLNLCTHCIFWDEHSATLEHLILHKLIQEEK